MSFFKKLFGGKKPTSGNPYLSASGKFSCLLVFGLEHHMIPVSHSCDLCGAPYLHSSRLIGLPIGHGLTTEDFEADVGGYCSQGCGNICPKHLRMGEYVYQGQRVMLPVCAWHGTPVTPRPGPIN